MCDYQCNCNRIDRSIGNIEKVTEIECNIASVKQRHSNINNYNDKYLIFVHNTTMQQARVLGD